MPTPDWSNREFLSSAVMNAAAGAVSGSFAQTLSGLSQPGLVAPETIGYTVSGLNVTVTAPLPFQTMFGTGVLSAASGITTGQTSSIYTVPFSGVVPGVGSVTAYLIASYAQIMEGPYQVVGPPPGHPDYDPTFVPFTAYATLNDSIALTASTTPADNATTFELFRTTLTSASTGIGALDFSHQQRAAATKASQVISVSGTVAVLSSMAGQTLVFTASGVANLPDVQLWNGLPVKFISATTGSVTLVTSGANSIYGTSVGSGVSSLALTQRQAVTIESEGSFWQATQSSPNFAVVLADNSLRQTVSGLQANEKTIYTSGAVALTALNNFNNFVITSGSPALTIPQVGTSLWNGFVFDVNAASGSAVITPNATDSIAGQTSGTTFTLVQGQTARFLADGVSGISVNFLTSPPGISPSPLYINSAQTVGAGQYLVDTSVSGFTLTLPGGAVKGACWRFLDAEGTWAKNNLIVNLITPGYTLTPPWASFGFSTNLTCDVTGEDFYIWFDGSTMRMI